MPDYILIDCPNCSVRIRAAVRGAVSSEDNDTAVILVACPSCATALLGLSELYQDDDLTWQYGTADRLWPAPFSVEVSESIPPEVRKDIKDARRCLSHGIYSATAVLCGRAIERLTRSKAPGKTLSQGLDHLLETQVIDARLHAWATELRKQRNLGAHANNEEVTRQDAEDVLAFTVAIFDYVYTLTLKYDDFMARRGAGPGKADEDSLDL